ncbi:hypothetical protein BE221DRAFT_105738 [Ostreococcus tauri]|uniref:Autophagy-related protein 101 n=1 Tax=Ostreococcus tauri TaxID=70448 RepID=A0A1Y5IQA9_OSTTA|nr:hypothetical protein BE221DRAFT_105738 [Ostreococcus tauri]
MPPTPSSARRCETFALPPLRCELALVRDVLTALVHTIAWTRALGCASARDERCERIDVRYVTCGESAVETKIRERCDAVIQWALRNRGGEADVSVSFYESERSDGASGTSRSGRTAVCWERWRIGLEIFLGEELDEDERARARDALRDQVVGTQRHILSLVNEMKAHVPPVTTSDVVSFPFEITTPIAREDSPGSFGRDMLRRIASLSSTPPSMI